jgi:alkylation response protein AidB-like acyl-CoA dehydrogenase
VGQKDQGWDIALSLLNFERGADVGGAALLRRFFELILQYLNERNLTGDPLIKQQLADIYIEIETARLLAYQLIYLASQEMPSATQASMSKLFSSESNQRCANAMMKLLGSFGPLAGGSQWAALQGQINHLYLQSFNSTLARGTSEIQRNILATRGLGLPRS